MNYSRAKYDTFVKYGVEIVIHICKYVIRQLSYFLFFITIEYFRADLITNENNDTSSTY